MNDPYRGTDTGKATIKAVPKFENAEEMAFWEAVITATESCPIHVGSNSKPSDVAARADFFLLLRRERLPVGGFR